MALAAQCQQKAPSGFGCAACEVWVNTTAELDPIRKQYEIYGCAKCEHLVCPAVVDLCPRLGKGACTAGVASAGDLAPRPIAFTCTNQP